MDPTRLLRGRGAIVSSSAHAVVALLLLAFVLLTLLQLPFSPASTPHCLPTSPLDCSDPELFHLMMRSAIDTFPTVHFSRFGRPRPSHPPSSCDMAWRARSSTSASSSATYKDYRRFVIARNPTTCAYSVTSIGGYHSGPNARKHRRGAANATATSIIPSPPVALSRSGFIAGKYLAYLGGGDRCKPMPHYLRSLLCAVAEARYLNRTLVLDLSLCLAASYAGTAVEGKQLGFYIDLEHLKSEVGIVEEKQFWANWEKWGVQGKLGVHLIEDPRVTPMKFSKVRDALILRKFGDVEPGNYWYHVCKGEAVAVLRPLQGTIRLAQSLFRIVNAIVSTMDANFDSVHVGANGENIMHKIEEDLDGKRQVYVAGERVGMASVEALKVKYSVHYLDEFEELWSVDSEWFLEMRRLNGGVPVEFDVYMREVVDREVFLKGKKKVEVFR